MHDGEKHTQYPEKQVGQGLLANSLIDFHSLLPLISLGFWGNILFNLPYVAEVFTRYLVEFGG